MSAINFSSGFLSGRFVAALLIMLAALSAFAQTPKTDSLRKAMRTLNGKEKVDAANTLSFYLLNYNNELFASSSNEALALSAKIGYEKGQAEALIISGAGQYLLGSEWKSDSLIRRGIAISKKIHENGLYGYGLVQLAINFQYDDQIDSAFMYLRRSYEVLKDSLHPYYLSRVYFGLAECYRLRSDYKNELANLNKCLKIREILPDESVTWLYVRMSDYYAERGALNKAEQFLDRAQRYFGKDTVDNETISDIQAERAVVFFKKGDYAKALNYFYAARKFYEKNSRKQKQVLLLYQIGRVFDVMGNYDLSLKNYFEALTISDSNRYVLESIRLNHAIGWSYLRLGQTHPAARYVQKSLDSAIKYRHPTDIADALNLLGMINGSENKNDQALRRYREALKIRELQQDRLGEATTLFNIGTIYEKLTKLDSSLWYQNKSLDIREKSGDEIAIADSYQLMGRLYRKRNNYAKADEYLSRAEKLAHHIKVAYVLLNVYQTKRDLLTVENKFEQAVQYSRLFENLRDSIFTNHLSSRLSILENIYNVREKEKEIVMLNQQRKLQQDNLMIQSGQIRQQRTIIIFAAGILLLVVAVAIVIFRYYQKVRVLNMEITERTEEIEAQSEELTESNHLLGGLNDEIRQQKKEIEIQSAELAKSNETISRINQGLEEKIASSTNELKQAYKELDTFFYRASHDFRRPLTTFMGLSEVAKITIKDPTALELFQKVNDTARSLDKMLFKLQSISDVGAQELIYKEVSLENIIDLELDNFKPEILKDQIRITKNIHLTTTFRSYQGLVQIILRNLLENSIDFHNKVDALIVISAVTVGTEVMISVQDNGEGIPDEYKDKVFDMYFRGNERSKGNGLGLYIVRKTVQKLNGRVEMTSLVGQGTTVKVFLPNQQ